MIFVANGSATKNCCSTTYFIVCYFMLKLLVFFVTNKYAAKKCCLALFVFKSGLMFFFSLVQDLVTFLLRLVCDFCCKLLYREKWCYSFSITLLFKKILWCFVAIIFFLYAGWDLWLQYSVLMNQYVDICDVNMKIWWCHNTTFLLNFTFVKKCTPMCGVWIA
jgi:hypothetical protein